jgi:SAM-dependent methyltransferase
MLHCDRTRAESFGEVAERYERTRPSYPEGLVDELLADGPANVLDLGCGTGKAAALLRERGCEVLGVEPDARMASVAMRKGIEVEIASFESWQPRGRRFDLVTSGQAWHWIDPALGLPKAAHVLRPGGRLAVFWNVGVPPPALKAQLDPIYRRFAPAAERHSVLLGNAEHRTNTIAGVVGEFDALFAQPRAQSWTWTQRYSASAWRELLLTHSDHRTLEPGAREALLEAVESALQDAGGEFEMTYETHLVSMRVRDR